MKNVKYYYAVNYNNINWPLIIKDHKKYYEKSIFSFKNRLFFAYLVYFLLEEKDNLKEKSLQEVISEEKIKDIWKTLPNIRSFLDLPVNNELELPDQHINKIIKFLNEIFNDISIDELEKFYLKTIFLNKYPSFWFKNNFKKSMLHNDVLGAYSNLVKEEYRR